MSDCACLYGDADGDGLPIFWSVAMVKARKPHRCGECQRPIAVGEVYERYSGKWDYIGIDTHATCAACREIREALYCNGGWSFTRLWEDIDEQIFSERGLTVECIDKLSTPDAKRFLQQRWMEYVEAKA